MSGSEPGPTLLDVVTARARTSPGALAFTFLRAGEEVASLTFGELDQRARRLAALLQHAGGRPGDRVLLTCRPGVDYVVAFWACLYAGVTVVPAHPPRRRSPDRLQAIVADARPGFVLGEQDAVEATAGSAGPQVRALPVEAAGGVPATEWAPPRLEPDAVAFLQYTSGSTSTPRGVVVRHRNVVHNLARIEALFGLGSHTRGVLWLPPFHDMGLIGGVLQPVFSGFPIVLLPPEDFVRSPVRWLEAISRTRATASGGPDFAYDWCVERIGPASRDRLDLSSWQVAFTGAEPIRARTLERFAEAFAGAGFDRRGFLPSYGLAEATLLVTGKRDGTGPTTLALRRDAVERGEVVTAAGDEATRVMEVVGCGHPIPAHRVEVVDPQTRARCPDGRIGEVWVAGPSVATGYHGGGPPSAATFGARLEGEDGSFLRTGDLGFLRDGELFVTGRLKDVMVLRGRKHHPEDVEATAREHCPISGTWVAFSVDDGDGERVVVAGETRRGLDDVARWVPALRHAVAADHELAVSAVVFVPVGGLPRTSSGKIRRGDCRRRYLEGSLGILATPEAAAERAVSVSERTAEVAAAVERVVTAVTGLPPEGLEHDVPLGALGIDSVVAMELQHRLETELGVDVPAAEMLGDLTPAGLVSHVLRARPAAAVTSGRRLQDVPDGTLSYGQRAMWFLQQLSPGSAAYNISAAFRLAGGVDREALQGAAQALVDSHESLRSGFPAPGGVPVRHVSPAVEAVVHHVDASGWDEATLRARLSDAAQEPFDHSRPPLLRVHLFDRTGGEGIVLFVAHHIITDLWSLSLLLEEFAAAYKARVDPAPAEPAPAEPAPAGPAPATATYGDFVRWQRDLVDGEAGARMWAYWREQLEDLPPALELPGDHPRPPAGDTSGARVGTVVPPALADAAVAVSRQQGATLPATLLAAFTLFLQRHTHAEDIVVGVPATGRGRAAWSRVAGYFVNPLPIRSDLSGNPTFADLLERTRERLLGGLENQDFPFPLMVERLGLARDVSTPPVFQTMFVMQQPPPGPGAVTSLTTGLEGSEVCVRGLRVRPVPLPDHPTAFDLTLVATQQPDGLHLALQYRTGLFSRATAERMLGRFAVLLAAVVEDPTRRVLDLPVLLPDEVAAIDRAARASATPYESDRCVHDLFELQARRRPDAVAAVHEGSQTTYAALDRRATALAARLQAAGVTPGSLVGVCLQRSTAMLTGLLAVLKAGAAYVPLDPSHPRQRLATMLSDAAVRVVVTDPGSERALPDGVVAVHACAASGEEAAELRPAARPGPDDLAYVTYTSGTTGQPKGVMVTHRNVANLFAGLDRTVGCDGSDTLLAVTGITFDISVLELLWTLCRGAKVVVLSDEALGAAGPSAASAGRRTAMAFSLFYFASDDALPAGDPYRLLLEGARFADERGFEAVWTPERHFHRFGGPYPNPAVTSAALATVTRRVGIRAGSVVLPLHHTVRVAEEWAVIDNLSGGRTGIAFASGWHPDDFAFFPEHYPERHAVTWAGIEEVRRLWRGDAVEVTTGTGDRTTVRTHPRPVQPELPVWVTAAGRPETFEKAGELGAGVLTHLLGQSVDDLAARIARYRASLSAHGHDPAAGRVTLMLHTCVGDDVERVRRQVREPFVGYLRSSADLMSRLAAASGLDGDLESLEPRDLDALLQAAFERYAGTSALFGTPESCAGFVERLGEIGVDEIACLIDFGVDGDEVLANLEHLDRLRAAFSRAPSRARATPAADLIARHAVTLLQCTPSGFRLLLATEGFAGQLSRLRTLLLGGEALPTPLAAEALALAPVVRNMYGPTETTVWSTSQRVTAADRDVPIGLPLANTRAYVLDARLRHAPAGVPGELWLAGLGVAAGYLGQPGLTAERFVADPYAGEPGARMYRTGDRAVRRHDGVLEFLGRLDDQVKVRGHRVELGEIEHVLRQHPGVSEAAVVARERGGGTTELVACVVAAGGRQPAADDLRLALGRVLPAHMLPAAFVFLDAMPLTPNRKLDRRALRRATTTSVEQRQAVVPPSSDMERTLAGIVMDVLSLERVGIDDNLFSVGGNSLLMVQVHSRVRQLLDRDVPLVTLFEYPTIRALAAHLAGDGGADRLAEDSQARAERQREALRSRRGRGRSRERVS